MAKPPALTDDGYEQQFGVNHLAHALFVKLLLPILQKTVSTTHDARIIFLTSLGFKMAPAGGIAFQDLRTVQDYGTGSTWARYGQSKLANVIYPAELARRYPEITSLSIHPGTIATDLIGSLGWFNKLFVYMANLGKVQGLEVGSYQACWASTAAKRSITNGGFYEPVGKPGEGSKESERMELWESLWEWTEKELSGY
ncbi:oxidoreductase, short-chain dehydrogenase/reductase family, partial [Aspergillus stella-maris]|uniref:oxidoreductase, short-chain dehydrogenase/reductase family n=1 Tax=Aspergillus stella-maris TaxID=1810926 RepID=UPI003CCDE06F